MHEWTFSLSTGMGRGPAAAARTDTAGFDPARQQRPGRPGVRPHHPGSRGLLPSPRDAEHRDPDIGELWPIIVIILGVAVIWGGIRRRNA
jgi:hypothetical protein